ncbi:RNA polymerase Rpb2, domain 7 [Teladorsagia circumcincta]|uniref:DNA-directed RNA polymerase n=1 Tax=Teladorsagia circumcincta TaxID=45464 RepID=A0A2G9UWE0_TELCI|nr:RNA polymerase Rpb2, domain 7 [Teladorsagia circumcincta]
MIESMAGKAAAMHGDVYDASPFVFNEKRTAIDHFGELLAKAGYNYHGNETFYSGVDGRQLEVHLMTRSREVFVRSTGPIDPITHQPVKGRKKGGGIRFGEMERDAIIAHGTAFVLQGTFSADDYTEKQICRNCGKEDEVYLVQVRSTGPIDPITHQPVKGRKKGGGIRFGEMERDAIIAHGTAFVLQVPRVFRYLTAELAAMNIKIHLGITDFAKVARA